jgi:hypothetical protein
MKKQIMTESTTDIPIKLEELKVFETPQVVHIDWAYALEICKTLDRPEPDEDRLPITGKAAIVILAEYGAIAHKCSFPPKSVKLAVVVCPPSTWFCPSTDGLDGVFIEQYTPEKFGNGISIEADNPDLFRYGSIDARMDGWEFAAFMVSKSYATEVDS